MSLLAPSARHSSRRGRAATFALIASRAVVRRPSRLVGLLIIVGFIVMAVVGALVYPAHLPSNPNDIYAPMSLAHPLGTDFEGTDTVSLLVTGAGYVLESAGWAGLFTVVIGTGVGLIAGYFIGHTDSALMRITDLFLTVPTFPLLIVLSTVWKFGSPFEMGLVLGVTGWGGLARAVRAQTLSLRERGFLEAARGLGLSRRYVILREILPCIAPYVAMNLMIAMIGSIYAEVGLFFLGVIPFKANSWGVMLNLAVFSGGAINSTQALPYLLSPLVAILLLTLGVVLFLDALDELFNPRLRDA
jgi:peptide/nickel transport system permease protein